MIHTFKTPETAWLSNMALVKVASPPPDGIVYASVEHGYQSAKSLEPEWKSFCSSNSDPYLIKKESKYCIIRPDWDEVKLDVMDWYLHRKFEQEMFKKLLLKTGNQNIQEGNLWGDTFWGVDLRSTPNKGENHLGRLIMKIRDEIRNN